MQRNQHNISLSLVILLVITTISFVFFQPVATSMNVRATASPSDEFDVKQAREDLPWESVWPENSVDGNLQDDEKKENRLQLETAAIVGASVAHTAAVIVGSVSEKSTR